MELMRGAGRQVTRDSKGNIVKIPIK